MRLGRFEKWILISCYRKTIQHELPPDWRRPRGHRRSYTSDGFHDRYLFKSEVLLNYFPGPRLSQKQSLLDDTIEKSMTTKEYRRALATYSRTAKQLMDKGLIEEFEGDSSPQWTGILLTDAGIEKALQLQLVSKYLHYSLSS